MPCAPPVTIITRSSSLPMALPPASGRRDQTGDLQHTRFARRVKELVWTLRVIQFLIGWSPSPLWQRGARGDLRLGQRHQNPPNPPFIKGGGKLNGPASRHVGVLHLVL